MTNVQDFFDKLNNEMAYHDPFKWLLDVEPEHIPEMIGELNEDIKNLNQLRNNLFLSDSEYYGIFEEYKAEMKRIDKSIIYKIDCINILKNLKEDYDNEQQTN